MKKVSFKVNGVLQEAIVDSKLSLLDFLREDLHLTGTKQSCDQKGQCGTCTVIVDGKAKRSCLLKVAKLDGANIVTIEGLGTPAKAHFIQEAFVLTGAIQCGFCTPGMIMAAKALLDVNNNPSREEIKKALRHNICRCTGYVKIIDAVKLAGRFLRGEIKPEDMRPRPDEKKIGISHPRPTTMAMACGTAAYGADYIIPGALELVALHSPHAHALIKNIDYSEAEKMPGVAGVITAKDIKGSNRIVMFIDDRPLLCEDKVRCVGDTIVAVAAETKEQALAAAKTIKIDYEVLPPIDSPAKALAEGAVQLHDKWPKLSYEMPLISGDAEKAFQEAPVVVESHFSTQCNHQAALETEVSLAYLEGEGDDARLVIIGRSIGVHGHLGALQEAIGWKNIRHEEAYSGGQFGIKLEITTEALAGAAALHFKKPIRYIPNLEETIAMTSKRHPYDMDIKIAANKDGKISALAADFVVDSGAYASIGSVCVQRSLLMLSSAYYIPHVKAKAQLVYTNNPWGGAARGAGPPQSCFAMECAVNMLADKVGMDPLEFRLLNSLKPGQARPSGIQVEQWPFPETCQLMRPHYQRACQEAEAHQDDVIKRGVGLASVGFGIGEPGDEYLVDLEIDPDDGVTIYAGIADPGEGNDAMLTQLAANELDLPLDKVRLQLRTTENTATAGFASGSRMTLMGGGALIDAAKKLKQAMKESGANTYQGLKDAGYPTRFHGSRKTKVRTSFEETIDPKTGQGVEYDTHVVGLQMAELEVNTTTGEVKVLKITTALDPGIVINPMNLEGQLEGGASQGVGFALREEHIAGYTKDWVTFKFPKMETSFEIESLIQETPRKGGTNGSTGIGELTMLPTAPAVISAIKNATGVWICDLPATPNKIKQALADHSS